MPKKENKAGNEVALLSRRHPPKQAAHTFS